jgi:aminopeptidase N
MMGNATFSKAMKFYFNKHQFANTQLSDFFAALQYAVDEDNLNIDLQTFRNQWIMTSGLNQVQGRIVNNEFIVSQSGVLADHTTLKNVILKVAFYGQGG